MEIEGTFSSSSSTDIQTLPSQFGHRVAIGHSDKQSLKSSSRILLSLTTELIFLSLKILELVRYDCPCKSNFAVLKHLSLFYLVVVSRKIFPIFFPETEVGFSGLEFCSSPSLTFFGDRCDILQTSRISFECGLMMRSVSTKFLYPFTKTNFGMRHCFFGRNALNIICLSFDYTIIVQ